ncbi:MAG TPA: TonB-dependent receptor [Xanthomonadaceae bacterium]|nr:TonB-dependent receptor [Xanthomonadaceae bacterium]
MRAADRDHSAVPVFGLPPNHASAGASSTTRQGRVFVPGLGFRVLDFGQPGCRTGETCAPATAAQFVPFDPSVHGFNFAAEMLVLSPQHSRSVAGSGQFELTPAVRFHAQVLRNERRSRQQLAPMPIVVGPLFFGQPSHGNPFSIEISADSLYNPFEVAPLIAQLRAPERFPRLFAQDVDSTAFSGRLEGEIASTARNWHWQAGYRYVQLDEVATATGFVDLDRLRVAAGPSFLDAAGVPRCGTPEAPIAGCVPFNFLGGAAQVTDSMWNGVAFDGRDRRGSDLHAFDAAISGEALQLPAGALWLELGYEHRRVSAFTEPDALAAGGRTTYSPPPAFSGATDTNDVHARFHLPLLPDTVALRGGYRRSDHSGAADAQAWSAELAWTPSAVFSAGLGAGAGFRQPAPFELFEPARAEFLFANDPCEGYIGPVIPRCEQDAPDLRDDAYTQGISYRYRAGGNPDLEAERSRHSRAWLGWRPTQDTELGLAWNRIDLHDRIGRIDPTRLLNLCYLENNAAACAHVVRTPSGFLHDTRIANLNLFGRIRSEHLDLSAAHRRDAGHWGRFATRLTATRLLAHEDSNACLRLPGEGFGQFHCELDAAPDRAGFYLQGTPYWRWRARLDSDWERGDWGARLSVRYLSGIDEDCWLPVVRADSIGDASLRALCSDPHALRNRIGSRTYLDAQLIWTAPWSATIRIGARNLTDRAPPVSYDFTEHSALPVHDLEGRFLYASYEQSF